MVLKTLEDVKWLPSRFLLELLRLEKTGQDGVSMTRQACTKERDLVVGFPTLFTPRNEEMGLVNTKKNNVTSKTVVANQLVDLR